MLFEQKRPVPSTPAPGRPPRRIDGRKGRNDPSTGAAGFDFARVPTHRCSSSEVARAEADGGQALGEVEIPKDKDEAHGGAHAVLPRGRTPVETVLAAGREPRSSRAASVPRDLDRAAAQAVAPGGTPTTGNASNDCLPSTASAVLDWAVVDAPPDQWAVDVRSLTLAGQVNVMDWPSNPSTESVPNTANPVDGGNINDTAGSSNHWRAAIDDMADYNTVGGGAGPNWHSTGASSAHEWAHWNTDYVVDSVGSAAGGNWTRANADLDALRVAKSGSATAADARTALQPQVDARMATWRSATIRRWNAIPDTAGVAGSTGYAAGAAVLQTIIDAVRAYAGSKGWTPAGPRNGPGRSPNPPP